MKLMQMQMMYVMEVRMQMMYVMSMKLKRMMQIKADLDDVGYVCDVEEVDLHDVED